LVTFLVRFLNFPSFCGLCPDWTVSARGRIS